MAALDRGEGGTKTSYLIRHSKSNDETRQLWWPNMLEVQWNRGPGDLATYMDHSQSPGMLLGFAEGSVEPIGHIAAVVNENSTGWVAMFIVKAQYRQLRLGAGLWDAMMQDFRQAGTEYIGLDAVPEQKLTYQRRGFIESKLGVIKFMVKPLSSIDHPVGSDLALKGLEHIDPGLLAEFERKVTGFYRPSLWRLFVERPDVVGVAAMDSAGKVVRGFATLRRAPMGARLSPLYADSAMIAQDILLATTALAHTAWIRKHPMQDYPLHHHNNDALTKQAVVCAEVWTGNTESETLFTNNGWKEAALFHRMWLNDKPTPEQSAGGEHSKSLWAILDAAIG